MLQTFLFGVGLYLGVSIFTIVLLLRNFKKNDNRQRDEVERLERNLKVVKTDNDTLLHKLDVQAKDFRIEELERAILEEKLCIKQEAHAQAADTLYREQKELIERGLDVLEQFVKAKTVVNHYKT